MFKIIDIRRWGMTAKLVMFSLSITTTCIVALGLLSFNRSSDSLNSLGSEMLEAVAEQRAHQVESYFGFIQEQMTNFAQSPQTGAATADFARAFTVLATQAESDDPAGVRSDVLGYYRDEFLPRQAEAGVKGASAASYVPESAQGQLLQAMYIARNPNPVGDKLALLRAEGDFDYNTAHERYHPTIKRYLESFGYYDIFLFDLEGNIVYSVFKETDFGTNFLNGPYSDSNLGDVYRAAAASNVPGTLFIEDFRSYAPSYGSPASFIASPVFHDGKKVGVAAFQMPVDNINALLNGRAGLGETGFAYLLGGDLLMRTNIDTLDEATILSQSVDTPASRAMFEGDTGSMAQEAFTGDSTLAAFHRLEINGLDWGVVAEMSEQEVLAPARSLRTTLLVIGATLSGIAGIGAFMFARSTVKPIRTLMDASKRLAGGDFSSELNMNRHDEIGELAKATDEMTLSVREILTQVTRSAEEVAGAATEIAASSEELAVGMDQQSNQTGSVAAAMEQMAASVRAITSESGEAAEAADQSRTDAELGGEVVGRTIEEIKAIASAVKASAESINKLGASADQIDQIIAVINDIADQTNLLALNAAIEAARAGEHGRGFAVVAAEVRKLAERTQHATAEVGSAIRTIQTMTQASVGEIESSVARVNQGVELAGSAGEALERIVTAAGGLRTMVSQITNSAKEQSSASDDIARRVETISGVTRESQDAASQAAQAATTMSHHAEQLRGLVSRFKV